MDVPKPGRLIRADDINPAFPNNWGRALPALGIMGVDFEERVDYRPRCTATVWRAPNARWRIRNSARCWCSTSTTSAISPLPRSCEWERDKLSRWTLLTRTGEPILWDFGSAAMHHKLYTPWLHPDNCRAGLIGLRGTVDPSFGLMKRHAEEIASLCREAGVGDMAIGVDILEPPMMFELQKAGLKIQDGQQVMLEAREIKSNDEIALLNRAAAMVDGAYDLINERLRPGVRENDIVADVNHFLYTHGSDDVEAINAISGERCKSASAQLHRPHRSAPAIRRSSTFSSRSWAIAPATTARSTSGARPIRSAMLTRRHADGSTTRWR